MQNFDELLFPSMNGRTEENAILGDMLQSMAMAESNVQKEETNSAVNRINSAQARGDYTPQGGGSRNQIKASVDEKGQVYITNIGTAPITQLNSVIGDSNAVKLSTDTVDAKIRSISQFGNTTDATMALAQLNSDYVAMQTNAFSSALKSAKLANHVPELEQQLNRLQAFDAKLASTNPEKYKGPSEGTIATMQLLERSRKSAEDMAKSAISTDSTLNALGTKIQGASKILEVQTNKLISREMKAEDKKEALEAAMLTKIASTPAEVLSRVKKVNPSFTDVDAVNYLEKGALKNPEQYKALVAPPEAIPSLAFVGKNSTALQILGEQEMAATGKSSSEVSQKMKDLNTLMSDSDILRQKAREVFGSEKSPEFQAIASSLQSPAAMASMKPAERTELMNVRFNVAKQIMSKQAESKFVSDVSTWQAPELAEAISKTASLKLPVTLDNVAQQFIGDTIGTARAGRVAQLAMIMRNASKSQLGSSLDSFDPEVLVNGLGKYIATPTLWDTMKKAIAPYAVGAIGGVPEIASNLASIGYNSVREGQQDLASGVSSVSNAASTINPLDILSAPADLYRGLK
jgi:hypothetical protein